MSASQNKRHHVRIGTRFETLYSLGRMEGVGMLTDISYSGALFEETTVKPDIGTEVRAYVFVQPVSPLELVGEVVRHTDNGFAIAYKDLDPEIRRLVEDAAAIVRPVAKGDSD